MAARQDLNAPNVYEKRGKGWQVRIQRKGWRVDETFPFVEGNEASRRDAFNRASARANQALQAITAGRSPHVVENREGTLRQAVQRYRDEEVPKHKGKAKEESRINQLMAPKGGLAGSAMLLDQRLENLHRQDFKDWRDRPPKPRPAQRTPHVHARSPGVEPAPFLAPGNLGRRPDPAHAPSSQTVRSRRRGPPGKAFRPIQHVATRCTPSAVRGPPGTGIVRSPQIPRCNWSVPCKTATPTPPRRSTTSSPALPASRSTR
ncbi:hypothetical protein [Burkholderia pseudomallei]|uniref:hypothetical protein n=1 Tax=Burkholderia pseudomallei TaxID=28450 RepID=UPI0011AB74B8|nr:hypothetical protein [Burkholderia pseudomallei]